MVFLGHVILTEGISMDSNKLEVVLKRKRFTNVIKICSFLGLAVYYRRLIERFSIIVIPMTRLTQKEMK